MLLYVKNFFLINIDYFCIKKIGVCVLAWIAQVGKGFVIYNTEKLYLYYTVILNTIFLHMFFNKINFYFPFENTFSKLLNFETSSTSIFYFKFNKKNIKVNNHISWGFYLPNQNLWFATYSIFTPNLNCALYMLFRVFYLRIVGLRNKILLYI